MSTRRRFLTTTSALLASHALGCGTGRTTPFRRPTDKPNVLVVLLDQLRACSMSVYGDPNIQTPAMDHFVGDGAMVEMAIAANPLCGPARASLLTGKYPAAVGVPTNDREPHGDIQTLATVLGSRGWNTGYVGKWHLGPKKKQWPTRRYGFEDAFRGYNERYEYRNSLYFVDDDRTVRHPEPTDQFEPVYQTSQALELMKRWADEPFALMVSYAPPHPPKNWRSDWAEHFPDGFPYGVEPGSLTLRPNVPDWAERPHPALQNPERKDPGARRFLRNYYGAILSMEPQIQRLLDGLGALGIDQHTLVVFTADHGDLGGSHGRYLKQKPYEESVRIPLGFRWTGQIPKRRVRSCVSQVDVLPTIAGLVGASLDEPVDGRDLSAVMKGGAEPDAPILTGCHLPNDKRRWWQIRDRRWAYTEYDSGEFGPLLFDLDSDPYEMKDLGADPGLATTRATLSAALAARRREHGV